MTDADYAERMSEQDRWPIGDTDSSAGTQQPTEDVESVGLRNTGGTVPTVPTGTTAASADLGSGLGATRGNDRQGPHGDVTGIGGTRGSGEGTGHLEGTAG
jgi:hypothetical protein